MKAESSTSLKMLRQRVLRFVEDEVYPAEAALDAAPRPRRHALLQDLLQRAKERDLWALGHPPELGGPGLPVLDYVRINEVNGRSFLAMQALATLSVQDSRMVHHQDGTPWRQRN